MSISSGKSEVTNSLQSKSTQSPLSILNSPTLLPIIVRSDQYPPARFPLPDPSFSTYILNVLDKPFVNYLFEPSLKYFLLSILLRYYLQNESNLPTPFLITQSLIRQNRSHTRGPKKFNTGYLVVKTFHTSVHDTPSVFCQDLR